MPETGTVELPIFPLGTVLFPDGLLPLRIFEQRYLDMTKACILDDAPFGVCFIRDGKEVGEPAEPFEIGCSARIAEWDMPHLGMFSLLCRGEQRFRIVERWVESRGLQRARVRPMEASPAQDLPARHAGLGVLLERIVQQVGANNFPQPLRTGDAQWVARRLCETLPLESALKLRVLEGDDIDSALDALGDFLRRNGAL